MTDLGDMLGLPDPFPAARRRAARGRVRCRNPLCRRPVYVDRAIYGYGEGCAEAAGLIRGRYPDPGQPGPDLLAELDAAADGVDQDGAADE